MKAAKRLRGASDPKALHDMRTSIRRARSMLRAYRAVLGPGARAHERALEEIADITARGRDAEVQLAWLELHSAREAKARIERRKKQGYELARKTAAPKLLQLAPRLKRWLQEGDDESDITFGEAAAAVIRDVARDLGERLAAIEGARDEVPLHKARIRAKRLRYVLEPFGAQMARAPALLEKLKVLQDELGHIHDLHLLRQVVTHDRRGPRLERDVGEELAQRFGSLRREWLGAGTIRLLREVRVFAAELDLGSEGAAPGVEIERKFLLRGPPPLDGARSQEIWQGWLPGEKLQERLRRVAREGKESFFRTVKLGRGIERVEVEEETPRALFERLWPLTEGRRVHKRRHVIRAGGRVWEIDEFLDRDLWLAEVELPSAGAKVKPPKWLKGAVDREVTGEDAYVNVNLAR